MLRIHAVRGNDQRLDGGAMFGNAPRAVWEKWYPPDERGRISLACRAMLIDEGDRKVLLETGIGAFFEPKLRDRFGVMEAEHVLLDSLAAIGLAHTDIDVVVLSHLHFDHAGGLLSAYEQGKPLSLLFPKARFIVSKEAIERARHPHARDKASFIPELLPLLEASGRLHVVEGETCGVLGANYRFDRSDGHTTGMLHTTVRGEQGSAFFAADLIPGAAWVHVPITMGYDRFPELLIDEKAKLLPRIAEQGTYVFFTHDWNIACARVNRDASGRYAVADARRDSDGWLTL
jgi:glyoxylase-like metal-dependent hydrolase (beta-lactamase superfamily II)